MSETEQKIAVIEDLLQKIEAELAKARKALRGESA